MEAEKDLIKREIQKIILLLNGLIEKIGGINSKNAESEIGEIEKALKSEFDLTLNKITQMQTSELIKHISKLHESHTVKIMELIYEFVMKTESLNLGVKYKKSEIAQKGIILVDFLNEKTKTFSMERMNMKNGLQQKL